MKKSAANEANMKIARRRKVMETTIWLLIIACFVVIMLQATGMITIFTLQGKWAIAGLSAVGLGLALSVLYQYLINSRLKETLKGLTDQQRNKKTITLPSENENEEQESEQDDIWKEQVRFSAVIEERQRLARELHDAVSQQLFAISMTATAVSRTIDRDWERAKRQVQLIEEMASVAQSEMRALLLHLRPVHLDGKNLGQALQSLVTELKQKIPMDIELEVDETIMLKSETEDHLFRIAQEALSNTLRHAKADKMYIQLYRDEHHLHMLLKDNGVGFDIEEKKQTSYGLLTMEERMNELGGTFYMDSEPNKGTTIKLHVPIDHVIA